MKTRAEVEAEGFELSEHGTIRTPGRFEGEAWWILNVEEWSLDGDGEDLSGFDEDGGGEYAAIFDVSDPIEREALSWGLDPSTVAILYTVSEQGFRSVQEYNASKLAYLRLHLEG